MTLAAEEAIASLAKTQCHRYYRLVAPRNGMLIQYRSHFHSPQSSLLGCPVAQEDADAEPTPASRGIHPHSNRQYVEARRQYRDPDVVLNAK